MPDPAAPASDGAAPAAAVERLKRRPQFLFVAQGEAERRRAVVVQGRMRPLPPAGEGMARGMTGGVIGAGFTTTKKVGNAVIRNRARRRLREAARVMLPRHGVPGADYVFIARQATADIAWARLLDDIESALISLARKLSARDDAQPPFRPPEAEAGSPDE